MIVSPWSLRVPPMDIVLDFWEDRKKFKEFNYHYSLDVSRVTLKPIDTCNAISPTTPPRLSSNVSRPLHHPLSGLPGDR